MSPSYKLCDLRDSSSPDLCALPCYRAQWECVGFLFQLWGTLELILFNLIQIQVWGEC